MKVSDFSYHNSQVMPEVKLILIFRLLKIFKPRRLLPGKESIESYSKFLFTKPVDQGYANAEN